MKPRVLLTGASGFLGRNLLNLLKGEIISLGRSANSQIRADLSSEIPIIPPVDVVIHAAGKAHSVPRSQSEAEEFMRINFEGTLNLCRAIEKSDIPPESFIFISSVSVYGLNEGVFIDESYPLNGSTPYAQSKIQAERFLLDWTSEKNIRLTILRLPLIAGPNPPGNLGSMINGIKTGRYLSIGKADVRKSMVWVNDIAKIIPRASEIGGIYNLTDGYHPTFRELETGISRSLGKRIPFRVPKLAAILLALIGDKIAAFPLNSDKLMKVTSTLVFADDRARKILGWDPVPVLEKVPEMVLEANR